MRLSRSGLWWILAAVITLTCSSTASFGASLAAPKVTRAVSLLLANTYGSSLALTDATFSGNPTPVITTKILRCTKAITKATTSIPSTCSSIATTRNYTVTGSDIGKYIAVAQTAKNSKGSSTSVSKSSGKIATPSNAFPIVVLASLVAKAGTTQFGGSATVGDNLVATPGKWDGYPLPTKSFSSWFRCESPVTEPQLNKPIDCFAIAGTLGKKIYTVTADDVGKFLTIEEIGVNKYSTVTAWAPTTRQVTGQPLASSPPALIAAATPVAPNTLSGVSGVWSGFPEPSLAFQWYRCTAPIQAQSRVPTTCSTIQDATNQNYALSSDDGGKYVALGVTATNSLRSVFTITASSGIVTQPPTVSTFPALTGTASVGESLAGNKGQWSGYPSPSFTYSWYRCTSEVATPTNARPDSCIQIADSSSTSYAVISSRAGERISFAVTASDGTTTKTIWSATTTQVTMAPQVATSPTDGSMYNGSTRMVGDERVINKGVWSGFPVPTYTYEWYRCDSFVAANGDRANCSLIPNQSTSRYSLTDADAGKYVQPIVTATNALGSVSLSIASSTVTNQNIGVATYPVISGTPVTGSSLTATSGVWLGYPRPTVSYNWYRCSAYSGVNISTQSVAGCTLISGATSQTYVLDNPDMGNYITFVATVGSNKYRTSTTTIVNSVPYYSSSHSVSGSRTSLGTLTATSTLWYGLPSIFTISRQWYRCVEPVTDFINESCAEIPGATNLTYGTANADMGKYIAFAETATNSTGSKTWVPSVSEVITSAPRVANTSAFLREKPMSYPGVIDFDSNVVDAYPSVTSSTYQIYRCTSSHTGWIGGVGITAMPSDCSAISGATTLSYTLQVADIGKFIVVRNLATNDLGTLETRSPATVAVTSPPVMRVAPNIYNAARVGNTLGANYGSWYANPSPTIYQYSWQWFSCDSVKSATSTLGADCISVSASSPSVDTSYTIQSSDLGKYILAKLSVTNVYGTTSTYTASSVQVTN